ncbi:hypothetical protein FOA43_002199 [Brettanomyces nanus]|uniref:Nucleolar pre-ribosomal-associated protein 1 n=1 Tax=Eeniella nana TaxID=13502 RepID=A0A875S1R6_EENNA|nr:uncharacterized protein FOA43_002199 [Brettanomyces nanus]QPG74863.1 hypothetical protein FOA43_002199 [Brettanomyces nanus]
MSDRKSKYKSNPVNSQVDSHFSELVQSLDEKTKDSDISDLLLFLEKDFNITSLGQSFSYASTANDSSSLASIIVNLGRLVKFASNVKSLELSIDQLIDELIKNANVFSKCLSSGKPSLVNPILRLMTAIITYNSGVKTDKLLESLDFSSKVLPKLAIPSKLEALDPAKCQTEFSVRSNFVTFWITLCNAAAPLSRKDILTTAGKVMSNIFKYIAVYDSPELQRDVLNFLDQSILMEPSYKRMTKCKMIGDWVMSKVVDLYLVETLRDQLHQLLIKMCTDETNGLVFPDDNVWFETSEVSGAAVSIGDRTFHVHNKLIYTMLTKLKPWADDLQLELVITVIRYIPELMPAYCYYCFFINGSHDPKLSSFYMGQSLMLLKLVRLPIPQQFIKRVRNSVDTSSATSNGTPLPASNVMEFICPSQLNRSAFTQGLASPHKLITHINTVLLIAIFQKFEKMIKTLSYDNNDLYTDLKNELLEIMEVQKLPTFGAIVGDLNEFSKKTPDNKILLLNYLKMAEYYHKVLGQTGSILLTSINLGQSDEDFQGVDLAILDCYLNLTSDSSDQNKWWNVAKGSENTLFTSLLRLPYRLEAKGASGSVTDEQITEVLSGLVGDSLIFSDFRAKTQIALTSQIYAILLSLHQFSSIVHNAQEIDKVCKVLDESVSRCVKTPYKYIDHASKYSSYLSPFYITVLEQSKFVKGDLDGLFLWIQLVTRSLFLLGEPLNAMKQSVEEFLGPDKVSIDFDLTSYETTVDSFFEENYKTLKLADTGFAELVLNAPLAMLQTNIDTMIPMSDIDMVSLITRCNTLVYCEALPLDKVQLLLTKLLEKMGNYLIQRFDVIFDSEEVSTRCLNLFDNKYWKSLYLDTEEQNPKKYHTAAFLNSLFYTLFKGKSEVFSDYADTVLQLAAKLNSSTNPEAIRVLDSSLWTLANDQVSKLLSITDNKKLRESLLRMSVNRNISLLFSEFFQLLQKHLNKENRDLFGELAKRVDVSKSDLSSMLAAHSNENMYPVLCSVLSSHSEFAEYIATTLKPFSVDISATGEGLSFLHFLSEQYSPLQEYVFTKAREGLQRVIDIGDVGNHPINLYLKIVSFNSGLIEQEDASEMVIKLMALDSFANEASLIFSKEFVSVILNCQFKEVSIINGWLCRETLYASKMFAETGSCQLPEQFIGFLKSMKPLINKMPVWKVVPRSLMNSQLEIILSNRWIENVDILKYVLWLLGSKSKGFVEEDKMLQIFINNEYNALRKSPTDKSGLELRYYCAVMIYFLFESNPKRVSTTDVQLTLSKFHLGTTRPDDRVLRKVLNKLEASLGVSWINYISSWEFQEESSKIISGDSEDANDESYALQNYWLVKESPEISQGLNVVLRKDIVTATIENFNETTLKLPISSLKDGKWEEFFVNTTIDVGERLRRKDFLYDSEFLMLLMLNNEELFNFGEEDVKVSAKALIESDLLQIVVMNLVNSREEIRSMAHRILSSVFMILDSQVKMADKNREARESDESKKVGESLDSFHLYKERSIFKMFLGNLLYTIEEPTDEESEDICPLIVVFLSYLVPVLNNPGHFMYEKVYRFMLGAPKFRTYEIPLFKAVMRLFTKDTHASSDTDNTEDYYRRLLWFLETLSKSITSSRDLRVLRRSGFLDTLMTLTSSPFVHLRVQCLIIKVLLKIVQIPSGADLLVRSSGLLAFLEEKAYSLGTKSGFRIDQVRNSLLLLNYQKMAVEARISSDLNGANKRTREWCRGDMDRSVKRVITSKPV